MPFRQPLAPPGRVALLTDIYGSPAPITAPNALRPSGNRTVPAAISPAGSQVHQEPPNILPSRSKASNTCPAFNPWAGSCLSEHGGCPWQCKLRQQRDPEQVSCVSASLPATKCHGELSELNVPVLGCPVPAQSRRVPPLWPLRAPRRLSC